MAHKKQDVWKYQLTKLDGRYPNIKREFPNARYMDISGNKFKKVSDAVAFRKRQTDYHRRVHKPRIKAVIV